MSLSCGYHSDRTQKAKIVVENIIAFANFRGGGGDIGWNKSVMYISFGCLPLRSGTCGEEM